MAGGRETWTAYTTRQYLSTGADTDYNQLAMPTGFATLGITVGSRTVFPAAMKVGTAGLVVFKDKQGDNTKITTVSNGEDHPVAATQIDGTNTTADHITFYYNMS